MLVCNCVSGGLKRVFLHLHECQLSIQKLKAMLLLLGFLLSDEHQLEGDCLSFETSSHHPSTLLCTLKLI